ncbi:MAG: hypothetical protein ABIQ12_03595 [Opitutaceae bacterium]
MCASPLSFLRAGPPPPKVAFLSDALFFIRTVPVAAGAAPAEAAAQIELALESVAPFPLAQLYYGWFWTPGAEQALVYAAYRRRFTTEQTAAWAEAELVLPAFAAVVGASVAPATTMVLTAPDGLTALYWEKSSAPARVLWRALPADSDLEQRAVIRDQLLRDTGESQRVIDLVAPMVAETASSEGEVLFRAGEFESHFNRTSAAALDVRDKAELASRRTAHKRDLLLWRVVFGCVAALLLLVVGELALIGGKKWNDTRLAKVRAQKPTVDKIMAADLLAHRIEELATKRMLPFEMISVLLEDDRLPPEIQFTRVMTTTQTSLYTITVEAKSTNVGQIGVYEAKLRNLPMIQKVDPRIGQTVGNTATFTLIVTFKPDTIKPAESIAP